MIKSSLLCSSICMQYFFLRHFGCSFAKNRLTTALNKMGLARSPCFVRVWMGNVGVLRYVWMTASCPSYRRWRLSGQVDSLCDGGVPNRFGRNRTEYFLEVHCRDSKGFAEVVHPLGQGCDRQDVVDAVQKLAWSLDFVLSSLSCFLSRSTLLKSL